MNVRQFHIEILRKRKWLFLAVILTAVVANFLQILIPLVIKEAVDALSTAIKENQALSGIFSEIIGYIMAIIIISSVMAVVNFTLRYLAAIFSQRIIRDLRYEIMKKYLYMPFEVRVQKPLGDLMSRMALDVDFLREWYAFGIRSLITGLLMFTLVYLSILALDWRLFAVLLLFLPLFGAAIRYWPRKLGPLFYENRREYGNLTHIIEENLMGIRVVRAYQLQDYEFNYFHSANQRYLQRQKKIFTIRAQYLSIILMFSIIMTAAILLVGGLLVISDEITIGTLVAVVTYLGYLYGPTRFLGFSTVIYHRANAGAERIIETLQLPEEQDYKKPVREKIELVIGKKGASFSIHDLWFKYPVTNGTARSQNNTWVLKGINLHIKAGEKIALIGPTGCGKSTLIQLLLRFYDPTKGKITLNDVDIRCFNLQEYRRIFGYVPQETFLFQGTIVENLRYADPELSVNRVYPVIEATRVSEFIERLPKGLETEVGERGYQLSGGQRQRIALARALLHNPAVLILDDALSAVDAETEAQIYQELEPYLANKTVIIVTHRISTLKYVDRVVLMVNGSILEEGSIEDLKTSGTFFPKLLSAEKTGFINFSELYEDIYQKT